MPFGSSRQVVPKGLARVAQRFNAGMVDEERRVPKGRLSDSAWVFSLNRPFGTYAFGAAFPALKRRAIVGSPSGTTLLGPSVSICVHLWLNYRFLGFPSRHYSITPHCPLGSVWSPCSAHGGGAWLSWTGGGCLERVPAFRSTCRRTPAPDQPQYRNSGPGARARGPVKAKVWPSDRTASDYRQWARRRSTGRRRRRCWSRCSPKWARRRCRPPGPHTVRWVCR